MYIYSFVNIYLFIKVELP